MDISLQGRSALVTGGTGSIGRALVRRFCESGAVVTFQYAYETEQAARLVAATGARAIQMDFTRDVNLDSAEFDILVNNAGVNIAKGIAHEVSLEEWDTTFSVNVRAAFALIRQCLPWMVEQKWGRIVNISSIYGIRGSTHNLPYTASKHSLSGITRTLAKEYAHLGVVCNEICPGPVDSDLMNKIAEDKFKDFGIPPEVYLKSVVSGIPAGRMCRPDEVAAVAAFLASEMVAYITGVSIPVDGGLTA